VRRVLPLLLLVGILLLPVLRAAAQQPLLVGAVVSETGIHAALAADYRKALLLWQEQVNAGEGVLGRKVELRLLDDGSEAIKAGALYRQLIADKADALIGPFGSAATLLAAAEAENAHRVLINGAGWSREVHKRAPRFVFQSATPYSAYGETVVQLAKDAGSRSLFILARDEPATREMAAAAVAAALKAGLAPGEVLSYGGGLEDFAPMVARAKALNADAWLAFGETRDAAEMVKSFKRLKYAPRLFFARGASGPNFIEAVGQDAEFVLTVAEYDVRFRTSGNEAFVNAFQAKWSAPPGPLGAEGYAAGSVLAEALRRAGGVDQEKLRAALASLEMSTVLGNFKTASAGEQAAPRAAVLQTLEGRAQIVWPVGLETAKLVSPYPQWNERTLLK
jgi:branched-chain amino acid transport system substrate-binding protein